MLHHGEITVNSDLGSGSTFIVTIPVDKDNYNENEMATDSSELNKESNEERDIEQPDNITQQNPHYNLPSLLLLEDNIELREYLAEYFGENFKVYQAGEGIEGLEKVNQKKPDVIVTDILMPNMDGYEFCKEVLSNFDT